MIPKTTKEQILELIFLSEYRLHQQRSEILQAPYREVVDVVQKSIDWSDMVIKEIKNALGGGGTKQSSSSVPTIRGI